MSVQGSVMRAVVIERAGGSRSVLEIREFDTTVVADEKARRRKFMQIVGKLYDEFVEGETVYPTDEIELMFY